MDDAIPATQAYLVAIKCKPEDGVKRFAVEQARFDAAEDRTETLTSEDRRRAEGATKC